MFNINSQKTTNKCLNVIQFCILWTIEKTNTFICNSLFPTKDVHMLHTIEVEEWRYTYTRKSAHKQRCQILVKNAKSIQNYHTYGIRLATLSHTMRIIQNSINENHIQNAYNVHCKSNTHRSVLDLAPLKKMHPHLHIIMYKTKYVWLCVWNALQRAH